MSATGIEKMVCEDIAARQQLGIAKYGVTVADNPLTHRQWLQHALEETYDSSVYLKASIVELDRVEAKLDSIRRFLGERYNRASVNENKPEVAAALKAIMEEIEKL